MLEKEEELRFRNELDRLKPRQGITDRRKIPLSCIAYMYNLKRQGIGTKLLKTAEQHMSAEGYQYAIVHLGGKEYFESRQFYPKHGYTEYEPEYMRKKL